MRYLASICMFVSGVVVGWAVAMYALHPPSASGDSASWVQAVGSIVAIIASAWTAFHLADQARSGAQQQAKAEASKQRQRACDELLATVRDCVTYHRLPLEGARMTDGANEVELDDLLKRIAWLRQQEISDTAWEQLSALRHQLVETAHVLRMYRDDGQLFLVMGANVVRGCLERAKEILEDMGEDTMSHKA